MEERPTPTPTPLPPDEMEIGPVEYSCSKMMDLALLLDGSNKLSEQDFEVLKDFTSGMMKKLHISQKKIRVSVLVYTTASNIYLGLKEIKPPYLMRRMVKNIKYAGGNVASIPEVLKYVIYHVFKKAPRTNAARIAMLFTASKSPGNVGSMFKHLRKEKITVIPIGLGPHISREQINLIESQSPENKAFIMNNVLELKDNKEIIIDYLCGLVREETVSLPPTVAKIIITPPPETKVTVPSVESGVTRAGMSFTTNPVFTILDVAFIVEGSEKVGERNFNISKQFIEQLVQRMDIGQNKIHITIIQYSHSVTVEYSFSEIQSKQHIIEKVRQIPYQGGGATNTGNALNYVSRHTFISDNGARDQAPRLVYMVTSNPSTDVITRVPKSIKVTPIGIVPNANIEELKKISQPDNPIIITSYNNLIPKVPDLVLKTCCSGKYMPKPPTSGNFGIYLPHHT